MENFVFGRFELSFAHAKMRKDIQREDGGEWRFFENDLLFHALCFRCFVTELSFCLLSLSLSLYLFSAFSFTVWSFSSVSKNRNSMNVNYNNKRKVLFISHPLGGLDEGGVWGGKLRRSVLFGKLADFWHSKPANIFSCRRMKKA